MALITIEALEIVAYVWRMKSVYEYVHPLGHISESAVKYHNKRVVRYRSSVCLRMNIQYERSVMKQIGRELELRRK